MADDGVLIRIDGKPTIVTDRAYRLGNGLLAAKNNLEEIIKYAVVSHIRAATNKIRGFLIEKKYISIHDSLYLHTLYEDQDPNTWFVHEYDIRGNDLYYTMTINGQKVIEPQLLTEENIDEVEERIHKAYRESPLQPYNSEESQAIKKRLLELGWFEFGELDQVRRVMNIRIVQYNNTVEMCGIDFCIVKRRDVNFYDAHITTSGYERYVDVKNIENIEQEIQDKVTEWETEDREQKIITLLIDLGFDYSNPINKRALVDLSLSPEVNISNVRFMVAQGCLPARDDDYYLSSVATVEKDRILYVRCRKKSKGSKFYVLMTKEEGQQIEAKEKAEENNRMKPSIYNISEV